MDYYIQGDAAKADQIRAAFEKLGYNTGNLGFTSSKLYYTIEGKVELMCTKALQKLIKTHPDYQELPVEPLFKVGDWIVQNDNGTVSQITKVINGTDEYGEYHAYEHTNGYFAACFENEFHLWSTADAKDGDVLAASDGSIFIYAGNDDGGCKHHMALAITGSIITNEGLVSHWETASAVKPATKEQRVLLFKKIQEAGYQWDADKKELKKIQPHYDIANFKPFDKVLVRCDNDEEWKIEFFCIYDTLVYTAPHRNYPFMGIGDSYSQCIPFNGSTKHLLGTTEMCPEEFINW